MDPVTILLALFVVLIVAITVKYYARRLASPPGPVGIPILGNLLSEFQKELFRSPNSEPLKPFFMTTNCLGQHYAKKSGVWSMQFGMQRFITIHSYDAAKEALLDRAEEFSGRPQTLFYQRLCQTRGLVLSQGAVWRTHRRFALRVLRSLGMGKSIQMEHKILFEAQQLIQQIHQASCSALTGRTSSSPAGIHTGQLFARAVSNVINQLVFSQRWEYGDPEFDHCFALVTDSSQIKGLFPLMDFFFPFLGQLGLFRLLSMDTNKTLSSDQALQSILSHKIDLIKQAFEQRKAADPLNEEATTPKNYVEAFFEEQAKDSTTASMDFSGLQCVRACMDLFAAGTDTTTNSLAWTMLYLAIHPQLQARLHAEIDQVCGRPPPPLSSSSSSSSSAAATLESAKDDNVIGVHLRTSMPFTCALMDEVQRHATVVPSAVDRAVMRPLQFRGHEITPDDVIFTNLYGIHHDPHLWQEPHRFNPDRFLKLDEEDGSVKYETSKYLCPFGMGKRQCLGESLAKMEYFLFLVSLMRQFTVQLADNVSPDQLALALQGLDGLIHAPGKHKIVFTSRTTAASS